tara:strand:- start:111 stop:575 length:465 start_codon:yes stop_codon:yes gene_type:complete
MKKMIVLFAFTALMFSCSKDDDNSSAEQTNEQRRELMVSGSPWDFESVSVLELTLNPAGLTNAEAQNIIDDDYDGSKLSFKNDGTGTFSAFGQTFPFSWGLNNTGNEVVLGGGAIGSFLDFSIASNNMQFTLNETCHSVNTDQDVCAKARFKFN